MNRVSDKITSGASYEWVRADQWYPQYPGPHKDKQHIMIYVADEFEIYLDRETLQKMLDELE